MLGTTATELLGYPENVNLRGNGCPSWCEWVSNDWQKKCPRGFAEAPCMASISPEMVMDGAEKLLGEIKKYSHSIAEQNIGDGEIVDHIFSKNLPSDAKIVDIFNKNGLAVAEKLGKKFSGVTVFMPDFPCDAFAKANGLELEYGCLYNVSMADDSSDVVIWQSGNGDMPCKEYILKELFRILKPGGTLAISGAQFADSDLQTFAIPPGNYFPTGTSIFTKSALPLHGALML
jgi:hypothetical protein